MERVACVHVRRRRRREISTASPLNRVDHATLASAHTALQLRDILAPLATMPAMQLTATTESLAFADNEFIIES